jgi:hypothetical protein
MFFNKQIKHNELWSICLEIYRQFSTLNIYRLPFVQKEFWKNRLNNIDVPKKKD